jgi:hypothetical protein
VGTARKTHSTRRRKEELVGRVSVPAMPRLHSSFEYSHLFVTLYEKSTLFRLGVVYVSMRFAHPFFAILRNRVCHFIAPSVTASAGQHAFVPIRFQYRVLIE